MVMDVEYVMRVLSYIVVFIFLLILVAFAVLNAQSVELNYYFGQFNVALSILLAFTFAAGCMLALLFTVWVFVKQKKIQYQLNQRLKTAEKKSEPAVREA